MFGPEPVEPQRTNYFNVYWICAGAGVFWADAASYAFASNSMLFFVPYQHIRFEPTEPVRGHRIRFHANFLCVETFHAEVGCSGVLFNDPYGAPAVSVEGSSQQEIGRLVERISQEQQNQHLAHDEITLAYLKAVLILATRLKATSDGRCDAAGATRHPIIASLRDLIEQHYRAVHAPSEYAAMLHMSPKALGRTVREQLGKTLTDLI